MSWKTSVLTSAEAIQELLAEIQRVAVLGIRSERFPHKPAFYVPAALARMGLEIIPVPVYEQHTSHILGQPVYHRLAEIPGEIDLVDVFRRAEDIPGHLEDILAKRPRAVWFQSGIRNDAAAEVLARAGITVVQDRCLMIDYRRVAMVR
ncbi:MAG: CoA-binding protein [Herpetosiphonaceae bacterium]|nr:MAG: CoA-binding protein [Herpetosiphonaceae bacterium]